MADANGWDWTATWTIVTAIATIVIAYLAWASYTLAKEIRDASDRHEQEVQEASERHQQELSDLYQAIVIATLLSGPSPKGQYRETKAIFEGEYTGKVQIFKESSGQPGTQSLY